jgi:hypothetical protein
VAVAVRHDIAAGEKLSEALVPPESGAAVMDEADPQSLELGRRSHGKGPAELAVVHVPLHGDHRSKALQLGEHGSRREIARVNDGVRGFEDPEALRRERTRAAREMRVSQERDQNRSGRNSPFR